MLRIKEAREARGWTQEQLAAEMNTTQQTIQRWESGQTDPKASVIKEISRVLGITVSFIMNTNDDNQESDIDLLSKEEIELVFFYRNMDKRRQIELQNAAKIECLVSVFESAGEKGVLDFAYNHMNVDRRDLTSEGNDRKHKESPIQSLKDFQDMYYEMNDIAVESSLD